jgi:hypothetical protein
MKTSSSAEEAGKTIQKGLIELRDALMNTVPEEVRVHSLNVRRERLLAWRALIDARLKVLHGPQTGEN